MCVCSLYAVILDLPCWDFFLTSAGLQQCVAQLVGTLSATSKLSIDRLSFSPCDTFPSLPVTSPLSYPLSPASRCTPTPHMRVTLVFHVFLHVYINIMTTTHVSNHRTNRQSMNARRSIACIIGFMNAALIVPCSSFHMKLGGLNQHGR